MCSSIHAKRDLYLVGSGASCDMFEHTSGGVLGCTAHATESIMLHFSTHRMVVRSCLLNTLAAASISRISGPHWCSQHLLVHIPCRKHSSASAALCWFTAALASLYIQSSRASSRGSSTTEAQPVTHATAIVQGPPRPSISLPTPDSSTELLSRCHRGRHRG